MYKGEKTNKLEKWRMEKWVSVKDYLNGKTVQCGSDKIGNNVCRPTVRIDSKTPITIQEVMKKNSKSKILKVINEKLRNMDKRINWNTMTIK